MSNIYKLKEAGIDAEGIIALLGGNEDIYLSILKKFADDQNYDLYQSAVHTKDRKSAETYIHTLKGVSANLGFKKLSLICGSILSDFKNHDEVLFDKMNMELSEEYNHIMEILNELQ